MSSSPPPPYPSFSFLRRLLDNRISFSPLLLLSLLLLAACTSLNTTTPAPDLQSPTSPGLTETSLPPAQSPIPNPQSSTSTQPSPDPSPSSVHPLPSASPTPFVFAVIGDYGEAGPIAEAVAALVRSWNPEIIITTGDNNYPSGEASTIDANIGQYYHSYIAPYAGSYGQGADVNRFFPSLGNHDWQTPGAQPYLDYFTLPGNERYYDFVWGPVHFFALSSDSREPDGVGRSSVQAQWFQQTIVASPAPWQIAYMHHPPYSSAHHGSTDWMQWPFAEWGADAVLAGHDHVYERLEVDDIPYITNGLGGHPSRYWFPFTLPESQIRYREQHGALRVTATDSTLTFEFITVDGEMVDTLTLSRAGDPVVPLPTATDVPPPSVAAFPEPAAFAWQPVATGYTSPILLTHAGDGSGRLFVVEQPGVIKIIGQDAPFLDIHSRVGDQGNEQGLLGLAFHPAYEENGSFYVNYTDNNGDTVIARYQVSAADPNRAEPDSEIVLLRIPQPYSNHNGGHLAFGPDGLLYIATGDGGSAGDPLGNAQNPFTLLGKILRISVDGAPYIIPPDNPFLSGGGLGEIWLYGLRNPWRFSFDRLTGDLYIADVGQNAWEEINVWEAGAPGGANFGWDYFEGTHAFEGSPPPGLSLVGPVWEYSHAGGHCSVTGGYVYRGQALPEWAGVYLYGDYCSGFVWGLLQDQGGGWQNRPLFQTELLITSFGEDEAGEVYLVAREGGIYQLVRR